jgi:hypothetical protein
MVSGCCIATYCSAKAGCNRARVGPAISSWLSGEASADQAEPDAKVAAPAGHRLSPGARGRAVRVCTLAVERGSAYTDSETWAGDIHPIQALRDYRLASGVDARLVIVGLVLNGFSIADPADGGMLGVVGFDTATPQLIADFARCRQHRAPRGL